MAVVETAHGQVRGFIDGPALSFRGIPYGDTTGGIGRFKPPQPRPPWREVRDCTTFGPSAPQAGDESTNLFGADVTSAFALGTDPQPAHDEDCLMLNVWTPAVDVARRPVMVWLHGGGFMMGSGSTQRAALLAGYGDVVVVSLNHRLGLLGFLDLHEFLGDDYEMSGIVGMLDIIQALEWVRENIGAFGGDPSCVTLFGYSGGGAKIATLLAMPPAQGLFHRAIIQSGPSLRGVSRVDSAKVTSSVLEQLRIPAESAMKLHDVPLADLVKSQQSAGGFEGGYLARIRGGQRVLQFAPVVGTSSFPSHPFDPTAARTGIHVPVIIGTTKDESTKLLAGDSKFGSFTIEEVSLFAESVHGTQAKGLMDLYRSTRPGATPTDLLVAIVLTDHMWLDSIRIAERRAAAAHAPTYMYMFSYETDVLEGRLRSAHSLEVPFIFRDVDSRPVTGSHPGRHELSTVISNAWINFARTGDPNGGPVPPWQPYDSDDRFTMIFDVESHVERDPLSQLRSGLDQLGLATGR